MILVSDYKNPYGKKFKTFISVLLLLVGVLAFYLSFDSSLGLNVTSVRIFAAVIGVVAIRGIVKNGFYAYRIRKALNLDHIEKISPLDNGNCLIVMKNKLYGIFDIQTRSIVLPPDYTEIEYEGGFYKIKSIKEKYGAFCDSLKKVVVPCEYAYADFTRNNCLRFAKDSTLYKMSHSGDVLDEHYYGDDLDQLVNSLTSAQIAYLTSNKQF